MYLQKKLERDQLFEGKDFKQFCAFFDHNQKNFNEMI